MSRRRQILWLMPGSTLGCWDLLQTKCSPWLVFTVVIINQWQCGILFDYFYCFVWTVLYDSQQGGPTLYSLKWSQFYKIFSHSICKIFQLWENISVDVWVWLYHVLFSNWMWKLWSLSKLLQTEDVIASLYDHHWSQLAPLCLQECCRLAGPYHQQ